MKKVLFAILLIGLFSQSGKTAVAADNKAIIGAWKVVVTDVPEEYSSSTITFVEKEAKLLGTVKFGDGSEVKLTSVKFDNSNVTMSLYVEGYEIIISGKVNGAKITGSVETPDGPVSFSANKVAEKK
jgi:hypothetical protein